MALTGIQIFKLLPKTNCGECGSPTCLAFAMALAAGKVELEKCPTISDEARQQLSEASAPPIRQFVVGAGDYGVKVGGETVMFRHEKTFFNKPGMAVLITDRMADNEVERRLSSVAELQYERVGLTLRAELVAIKEEGNRDRFLEIVKKAASTPYGLILMSHDPSVMKEALQLVKEKKPVIYAATDDNVDAFGTLAREYGCPVAVRGRGLEETTSLSEKLIAMGVKDIVIDPGSRSVKEAFTDQIIIRRAALQGRNKALGFPTIAFPCEMADDPAKETLIASLFIAKYAGLIVLSDFQGDSLFPLLLQRLNIYTDPQRPMTTQQGIYPINNPDADSPVMVTCNFSLTYFIVSGEIESSRVPTWLCVMDTEGLSVMTAWAAGKFVGDTIGPFINKSGIGEKVNHKKLIIPGYAAAILGDLEEELPGWEITVGPREAAHIPAFLKAGRNG
ncbi:MAG: Corrinoid/iron-sulfur protein large subunit [Syntrophorhabdaceae bacterium PtaU1.Bin034]|jgi:acetyl-CoA decarbonylase/synthase complex subunit gamma|nr:MAG: Corrinoid/iron-sulfur protein large subunit [Syntrophorhabdaceae bacterium PtaU1.Bin034]